MSRKSVLESYNALYKGVAFERFGLFKLVAETYPCREVLYPGCSIHLTPSFVFPHVVYVDKSPEAKTFFDARVEVLDFISRNRGYKRKPFIQFIPQDSSTPLPLQKESFDLLLSLFAGQVALACEKYLRPGGLLLTNQRAEAGDDPRFDLVTAIRFRDGQYRFVSAADAPRPVAAKKYLHQTHRGLEYTESETYFLFKKCP